MLLKNKLVKGTFILTFSGLLSRFIGFFYRVFLSRAIGAEGLGLYQIVFPLYMLAYSITVSGIQTSISRLVSARFALYDHRGARHILLAGILLSLLLSVPVSAFLFFFCHLLSSICLKTDRAAALIRLMAFAIPFGSFHACVDGYYFGMQKTGIPAIRQLLEQGIRFLLLFLLCQNFFPLNHEVSPLTAVFILVAEEAFAALFSFTALFFHSIFPYLQKKTGDPVRSSSMVFLTDDIREIGKEALPLSGNRFIMCILQSCEASLLPVTLQLSGYGSGKALSIYGILSGMALPMVLFPTAITSSLSTMLLPSVSAARASQSASRVRKLIRKSCRSCLAVGILFSLFFLFFGRTATAILFQNALAGFYVQSFAFICPLLYLNPVLFSILNGLGQSSSVFFYNLSGLILRLLAVLLAVPRFGITGYFCGLFLSKLLCCFLCTQRIHRSV